MRPFARTCARSEKRPTRGRPDVRVPASLAEAFGAAYVVEGSALGGHVLSPLVECAPGGRVPTSYLRLRGDATHAHWQRWLARLQTLDVHARADERRSDPRLRASVLRLQGALDIASLCNVAAEEVRAITGFDRVMVYRFDADWNGEVVAESRRDDLEPFLGLHYPASDIADAARGQRGVPSVRSISRRNATAGSRAS